jgi:hypothetical protein
MARLASAAGSHFVRYDPGALVAAVNALLPLGKDKALDAVEHQLVSADRAADPQHGLFLVLRLLFEVPDSGSQPTMRIGIPEALKPHDPRVLPYFPLLVVDDIPFLLVTTILLGGSAERVETHLDHFRALGVLRGTPLQPRADLAPEVVLDHVTALYRRAYGVDPKSGLRVEIEGQLSRLIAWV